MREIKFKFYEKKGNSYEPRLSEDYLVDSEGRIYSANFGDNYLTDVSRDMIAVPYTGFKDKNGTKIFDGDIISCQLFCPESNNCWITNSPIVVEWEEYGYDPFIEYGAPDHSFLVEIIGSIYENPELLKEEKND